MIVSHSAYLTNPSFKKLDPTSEELRIDKMSVMNKGTEINALTGQNNTMRQS